MPRRMILTDAERRNFLALPTDDDTVGGQCAGKREMYFLRARHFLPLSSHPLRRVSFRRRTGIAESGLPFLLLLRMVRTAVPSLGCHFPASALPSVRCLFAPPSPGGVLYIAATASRVPDQ